MDRQFAQPAFKLPKFPFHFSATKIIGKIFRWLFALSIIAFAVYYFGVQRPAAKTKEIGKINAERNDQSAAFDRALSYPDCSGAAVITRSNPKATIKLSADCWSRITVRTRYYYANKSGNSDIFIWDENDYLSGRPPKFYLDGTPVRNQRGDFRIKTEKGSAVLTIEAR